MSHSYQLGGGKLTASADGKVYLDATRKALQLIPAPIVLNGYSIAWPDFPKGNAYFYDRISAPVGGDSTMCRSYITLTPQEWQGADIVLGTVPVGTNSIDVQIVSFARTKDPSPVLGRAVPKCIRAGATLTLDGGSCTVETYAFFSRLFEIVLGGSDADLTPRPVILRRYQSVRDAVTVSWNPTNSGVATAAGLGWSYGGANGIKGRIVSYIQQKGYDGGSTHNRNNGGNACDLTDNTDFSSIWTGTIIVTPRRIG
jgi:hypothetical protein